MKLLESKILDFVNSGLDYVQEKTHPFVKGSFLLQYIDLFIVFAIALTLIISAFAPSDIIGFISVLVPLLVVLKVLITKGEKIEFEQCNFFLLIYLLICLLSNFTSSMLPQSLYGFMKTLIYFGFYFALCQFLKNNQNYIKYLLFIVAALIEFEGITGIIQNSLGLENISTWQDTSYVNPEDVLSRVYGTLNPYNPNLLAGYLIAGISSLCGLSVLYFNDKKKIYGAASILLFAISVFTLFLTGCRGAYLALIVMILCGIYVSYNIIFRTSNNDKYKKIWKNSVFAGFILSIIFMLVNHGIWQRLMSVFVLRADSSTSFRMNVYNSAIQMFQDNFLFGIGVGNKVFREIYGLYMLSGFDALSCYCVLLEMAVESGIFAAIFFILFLIALLYCSFKMFIKSNDINQKILIAVAAVSIIGVMIHGIFDTIFFRPQVQFIFWTMAAILVSVVRKDNIE
ncbi:O-antigen ligase family protein [bacterium]|nr:O-antigen ligase family protein [bacterium]